MRFDYEYMARTLASLSGLPVRLYYGRVFQGLYHHSKFKPDLAMIEEDSIFRNTQSVSYYMTGTFLFFGLFRVEADDVQFVLGPVTSVPVDKNLARSILVSIGEPSTREKELKDYFQSIPSYPLRNFLQILCTFDFFLNGNKRDVSELILAEHRANFDPGKLTPLAEEIAEAEFPHNTYDYEQEMLSLVEHGRTEELKSFFAQPPAGRAGAIAQDSLRQQKNLMVCSTTLVSRAAIRGGLDRETAYTLSDVYIQQSELLNDPSSVTQLMNGCEAARAIRALDRADAKKIPIIAMTADIFEESIRAAQASGMDRYLTKPILPEKLFAALEENFSAGPGA